MFVSAPFSLAMRRGQMLADVSAVLGLPDVMFGEVDRAEGTDIRTALVREGRLALDPPGLSFDVAPVLRAVPSEERS